MKRTISLVIAVMAILPLHAQLKILSKGSLVSATAKPSSFSKELETILLDFPYGYRNIAGELILAQAEVEHYESKVLLSGAESCTIARYRSVRDTSLSWQAIMYRHEEFEPAAKKYKEIYRQLKSSAVTVVDGSKHYLEGAIISPAEEQDFTVTTMRLGISDRRYKDFKVELEMVYRMPEWVININLVTRKKDEDVRPDWMTSGN